MLTAYNLDLFFFGKIIILAPSIIDYFDINIEINYKVNILKFRKLSLSVFK